MSAFRLDRCKPLARLLRGVWDGLCALLAPPADVTARRSTHRPWRLQELEERALPSATPLAPDFRINTTTALEQQTFPETNRSVAMDANGNFVAVWSSKDQDGDGYGVFAQRYNTSGTAVGPEFRVNTHTARDQINPAVAMDPGGCFVITWSSKDQDGDSWGVYGQYYDSSGAALGSEFQVNSTTTKEQILPSVAMDANGYFVVVWSSKDQDGNGEGIFGQQFDSSANAVGPEFQVNTFTNNDQTNPAVAMDAGGGFVVVWSSKNQDGDQSGVYGQYYDSSGTALGSEFQVNTWTTKEQQNPTVATDANGNFVVAWASKEQDGNNWGIFAQRYNYPGTAVGSEFQVNTATAKEQMSPSVALDPNGSFAIAWASHDDLGGGSWGIYARQYDAAGVPAGGEFLVNATNAGNQENPSVALGPAGEMVVVWSGDGPGDGNGVFGRQFTLALNTPPTFTSSVTPTVLENTTFVQTLTSTDPDGGPPTYSISGGADAGRFTINGSTGDLAFVSAPDFENPTDANGDNVYQVTVQVSDGAGGSDTQALSVTVSAVGGVLVVDTAADTVNGNTSSIGALLGNKGADGRISLREAILATNNTPNAGDPDTIRFNISGAGVRTINLTSALPTITDPVTIDGWSQPGFANMPLIELNGASAGGGSHGLFITAGSSTVHGLIINRFGGDGIRLLSGGGNLIQGNYIGTNGTGTVGQSNGLDGIRIDNSANNLVGGKTAQERNVISWSGIHGLRIVGAGATGNIVQGNFIGTDATGLAALGNGINGIWIASGASNNVIGGTATGAGNVVSGNWDTGIEIQDSTTTGNLIQGNIIGLNATGTAALGNLDGVIIEDAPNNTVGGPTPAARNVISGNTGSGQGNGVVIFGTNATGNLVQNNYIGTDSTGTLDRGNAGDGILISDRGDGGVVQGAASNNVVRNNVISGNNGDGVEIAGGASNNAVQGNLIGVTASGSGNLGNNTSAVLISSGSNNAVGGTAAGDGNVLGFSSSLNGVRVVAGTGNAILGNAIHSNAGRGISLGTGAAPLANDSGDSDSGPNRRQNYPVLSGASTNGSSITLTGSLNSTSSTSFRVEFFANATADGSGHGEGERYLGFVNVTTNGSGNAAINATLPAAVAVGEWVTATATNLTTNDTSEFAQNRAAVFLNTPPTLTSNGGGASANMNVPENSTAVTTATATDAEAPPQTLTWSISGGVDAGRFSINGSTGDLVFASAPDFENPTDANADNIYQVTVQVSDGAGGSDTQAISVTVTNANEAPVALSDAHAVPQNAVLSVGPPGLLANDTDPDGDALTAALVTGAAHGLVTVNPDGSFTYTPDVDYQGGDGFSYWVNDGQLDSNVATVTLTVNPVNDAPLASSDNYSVSEDGALTIPALGVLANDFDADGDALTAALVTGTAHGLLTLNLDGSFSYTPDPDYAGADSFTYQASDGQAGSNVATVAITVNPVDDAPVAIDDSYGTGVNIPLLVGGPGVLGNDSDVEGDALTATLVAPPSNGLLVLNPDGSFLYTPNLLFVGTDSFTYQANDLAGPSAPATVTITVGVVGSPPLASADAYSISEDGTFSVSAAVGVLANDTDADGDPLTATLVTAPAHGLLTLNLDGSFIYAAAPDYHGMDSFTYQANDGQANSNVATVTITVNPVNDPPVAGTDSYSATEDAMLVVSAAGVLVNDTDIEGDALTAVLVAGPTHGILSWGGDGSFSYTPDADYHGADSFTYQASDGASNSAVTTVSLTVNPVNDAPVATGDSYSVSEDAMLIVPAGGVLNNDADADGDALVASLVAAPSHGILTLNADGSFSYAPAADYHGADSFTYQASDGSAQSAVVTVALSITPVNDAPVALGDSYSVSEDATLAIPAPGVLANDNDIDGDSLTAVLVAGPTHGSLSWGGDGSFSYTPNADYHGADSFTYRADDGQSQSAVVTVALTVTSVNDAPVAAGDSYSINEDATLNVNGVGVFGNDADADADPLTATLGSGPSHGVLTLNADGSFSYAPDADYHGIDAFTYQAGDGQSQSAVVMVSLTVNPVNDVPMTSGETYSVAADGTLTVTGLGLLSNDWDADGDTLTVVLVSGPTHGSLILNADGSFAYTPASGFSGADSFTYRVDDGVASSGELTVTVTVAPTPLTPPTDPVGGGVVPVLLPIVDSTLPPLPAPVPLAPTTPGAGTGPVAPPATVAPTSEATDALALTTAGPTGTAEVSLDLWLSDSERRQGSPRQPAEGHPPEVSWRRGSWGQLADSGRLLSGEVEGLVDEQGERRSVSPPVPGGQSPGLWRALDETAEHLESQAGFPAIQGAAVVGVLAAAGYVLLNTRAGFWLLSALTSRPLWKEMDPLEVVYSWEQEVQEETGSEPAKEESLLSLVE